MFRRAKALVGLDIGSSAVKAVELKPAGKAYKVTAFGSEPIPPDSIVDGAIIDGGAVADAIRRLFDARNIKTRDVAASLSGNAVIVKKISLPVMTEAELSESIYWEAEQYIPFDIQDVNLDYQILDAGGGPGGKGTMDVLLVAAKKEKIADYTGVIAQAGRSAVVVDVDAFRGAGTIRAAVAARRASTRTCCSPTPRRRSPATTARRGRTSAPGRSRCGCARRPGPWRAEGTAPPPADRRDQAHDWGWGAAMDSHEHQHVAIDAAVVRGLAQTWLARGPLGLDAASAEVIAAAVHRCVPAAELGVEHPHRQPDLVGGRPRVAPGDQPGVVRTEPQRHRRGPRQLRRTDQRHPARRPRRRRSGTTSRLTIPMNAATYSLAGRSKMSSGVPSCSIRPARMIAIRWPSASASDWSWVT